MFAKLYSAALVGVDAQVVEIEVDVSPGMPGTAIVGLADISIREARERIRPCIKNLEGYHYPIARIAVNLAPAALPKFGTQFDLPMCIGILAASGQVNLPVRKAAFIGELSLDGAVRSVAGVLAMVLAMKEKGFTEIFLPAGNAREAALVSGVCIYPLMCIEDLLEHVRGGVQIEKYENVVGAESQPMPAVDFADIIGQSFAKRAAEISAAGGHNLLMVGNAGVGKTMLAEAMPGILPQLTPEELLQVTKVYSSAGLLVAGFAVQRPFRNPHHTVTVQAFLGGGYRPIPGEVTLAHNGVLFLDEFPEFPRALIESLRQPLEAGYVDVTRLSYTYRFPCNFILVAAHNPCPCGAKKCTCTAKQVIAYSQKISAPIMDRIDLRVAMSDSQPVGTWNSVSAESSGAVAERVAAARQVQAARCAAAGVSNKLNARLSRKELPVEMFTPSARKLLDAAAEKYQCSARSHLKIQRVSRTIADLTRSERIDEGHVAEALQYKFSELST